MPLWEKQKCFIDKKEYTGGAIPESLKSLYNLCNFTMFYQTIRLLVFHLNYKKPGTVMSKILKHEVL